MSLSTPFTSCSHRDAPGMNGWWLGLLGCRGCRWLTTPCLRLCIIIKRRGRSCGLVVGQCVIAVVLTWETEVRVSLISFKGSNRQKFDCNCVITSCLVMPLIASLHRNQHTCPAGTGGTQRTAAPHVSVMYFGEKFKFNHDDNVRQFLPVPLLNPTTS